MFPVLKERDIFRKLDFLPCYGSILYVNFQITSLYNVIVQFFVYIIECDHLPLLDRPPFTDCMLIVGWWSASPQQRPKIHYTLSLLS